MKKADVEDRDKKNKGTHKEFGILEYTKKSRKLYRLDLWLTDQNGKRIRKQVSNIPTLAGARQLREKLKVDAFEGRFLSNSSPTKDPITVSGAWEAYKPAAKREKKSWKTDLARAEHLTTHMGSKIAQEITLKDIDAYRTARFAEKTKYKRPPTVALLNREVALLRRVLNYAVACGELDTNPIAKVKMLREDNVRTRVIEEDEFDRLLAAAEPALKPILLVAYDTGLRKTSILKLKWPQIDLKGDRGKISLAPQDVKANSTPTVVLTSRVRDALRALPRSTSGYVFVNPKTNKRWNQIQKMWSRARKKAKLEGVWFHDLRRSFITLARRKGVDESTIMSMSGHKTRSAFDRYNIVSQRDQERAVALIEAGRVQEAQTTGKEGSAGA